MCIAEPLSEPMLIQANFSQVWIKIQQFYVIINWLAGQTAWGNEKFYTEISDPSLAQWVNSVPPYVRKLHFMYEAIRTSGKCRWNIYRTSSKCRWSIYRKSRKRRGTLRIVHKVERSSPTVIRSCQWNSDCGAIILIPYVSHCNSSEDCVPV